MARIAIISDIHANNQALNQVLKDIEKRNIAEIIKLDYKDTLRTVYFDMVNSHNIGNAPKFNKSSFKSFKINTF